MSDLDLLAPPARAALGIKLEGYIEACVALAHVSNVGLGEALSLTTLALMREMHARGLDRCHAMAMVTEEMDKLWPRQASFSLN
jgi:hypothetical protein